MNRKPPRPSVKTVVIKTANVLSVLLLIGAVGGAAFVAGFALAFSQVADTYAEVRLLKARAAELEGQIIHLKNYAILIDALTTHGQAANELLQLPHYLFTPTGSNSGEGNCKGPKDE